MKALTLWQPWASLIALGVKTIETRGWSTSYRGPLAIHASKRKPDVEMLEDGPAGELYDESKDALDSVVAQWWETPKVDYDPARLPPPEDRWSLWTPQHDITDLPLGRVVATCELVDVVPTESLARADSGWLRLSGSGVVVVAVGPDQRPYGDFAPGRFAWLLADVVALDPPVRARGAQGLWEWT